MSQTTFFGGAHKPDNLLLVVHISQTTSFCWDPGGPGTNASTSRPALGRDPGRPNTGAPKFRSTKPASVYDFLQHIESLMRFFCAILPQTQDDISNLHLHQFIEYALKSLLRKKEASSKSQQSEHWLWVRCCVQVTWRWFVASKAGTRPHDCLSENSHSFNRPMSRLRVLSYLQKTYLSYSVCDIKRHTTAR